MTKGKGARFQWYERRNKLRREERKKEIEKWREYERKIHYNRKKRTGNKCIDCGKLIYPESKRCKSCNKKKEWQE